MAKKKVTTTTVTTVTEEIITNEKTHIICILDRSGSMASIINDSIGGFNTFLRQQKELSDQATITVALFDDQYELVYDNIDIKKAEELTSKIWSPRGMTALFDAIGKTINTEKANFVKLGDEKPAKVLVCIITDGQNNASKEFTSESIKKMVKQCENDNWNFIFLGANIDSFSVGESFGMSAGNTINYTANTDGVKKMSQRLYDSSASYRGMDSRSADFNVMSKTLLSDDKNINNVDPNFLVKDNDGSINISSTGGSNVIIGSGDTNVNNTGMYSTAQYNLGYSTNTANTIPDGKSKKSKNLV